MEVPYYEIRPLIASLLTEQSDKLLDLRIWIRGARKPKVITDGASMDAYGATPYTTCFRYIRERMEKGGIAHNILYGQ